MRDNSLAGETKAVHPKTAPPPNFAPARLRARLLRWKQGIDGSLPRPRNIF